MSKLKELTWANHQKAERTEHARKLLKGMTPLEYHTYLFNQYVQYVALETVAKGKGVLVGIEHIARAPAIRSDMEELEIPVVLELDSILEKISKYGRNSLTMEEFEYLHKF